MKALLWIFSFSFILHNLEELFIMGGFLNRHLAEFPAFFQPIAVSIQPAQYSLAIWMLNCLTLPLTWWAIRRFQFKQTHQWISLSAILMGINALMHLSQSLFFTNLAPGSGTAAILILPISTLLVRAELKIGLLQKKHLILYSILAVLVMPLIIGVILSLAGWILSLGNSFK